MSDKLSHPIVRNLDEEEIKELTELLSKVLDSKVRQDSEKDFQNEIAKDIEKKFQIKKKLWTKMVSAVYSAKVESVGEEAQIVEDLANVTGHYTPDTPSE